MERLSILTEHKIFPFMDCLFGSLVTDLFRKLCNLCYVLKFMFRI